MLSHVVSQQECLQRSAIDLLHFQDGKSSIEYVDMPLITQWQIRWARPYIPSQQRSMSIQNEGWHSEGQPHSKSICKIQDRFSKANSCYQVAVSPNPFWGPKWKCTMNWWYKTGSKWLPSMRWLKVKNNEQASWQKLQWDTLTIHSSIPCC